MEGLDPNLLFAQMGKDSNGDDKTLWLFLLLLLYGKDGFGRGSGGECCPPVTLEQLNDAQNAIQAAQMANTNSITERTLDITRDQSENARRAENGVRDLMSSIAATHGQTLLGQKDLTAAIAECCCNNLLSQKDTQKEIIALRGDATLQACETRNAIDKCYCETNNNMLRGFADVNNNMAMQTQVLTQQGTANTQRILDAINQNRIDELQAQLTDAKLANSNLVQTNQINQKIQDSCCQPCQPHPHPWWLFQGGNGGPPGPPAANMG